MEPKEYLPIVGVIIGWALSQITAYLRGRGESLRSLGRAISTLYFLNMEMIQLKMAIEAFKNQSSDVKEWESYRQRAFKRYVDNTPEFSKQIEGAIERVSESFPTEGYNLREIVSKYQFIKTKSLEPFVQDEKLYVRMLSSYEAGFLGYQYLLEKAVRRLAIRHSVIEWVKIELQIRRIKKSTDKNDLVFGTQVINGQNKSNK